jgi:hypothetical protein
MPGKHGLCFSIDFSPKAIFRELFRGQSLRQQGIEFFLCPRETRHRALFDRSQSGLHDFVDGLVGASLENILKPPFLLRREVYSHVVPHLTGFRVQETLPQRKRPKRERAGLAQTFCTTPERVDSGKVRSAPGGLYSPWLVIRLTARGGRRVSGYTAGCTQEKVGIDKKH